MPNGVINLGQINFTNSLPLNFSIAKWKFNELKVYNGCPSEINTMMKDNILHVAPVSSVEYLNNQDKYTLLGNICISSTGRVDSVILFSNCEFKELSGKNIAVPYTSACSIALLKILLAENSIDLNSIMFHVHRYELPLEEFLGRKYDAVLYIGDPAFCANIKHKDRCFTYDLGDCWYKMTNLPMVFAVWVASSAWMNNNYDNFLWIKNILDKAVESGLSLYFNDVINLATDNLKIDKIYIEDYLTDKIRYKFTEDHMNSLELFKKLYNKFNVMADIATGTKLTR